VRGLLAGAAGDAVVTAVTFGMTRFMPGPASACLYVLPALLVGAGWGVWPAVITGVGAALLFDFFFWPPEFGFSLSDPHIASLIIISAVVAVVVSRLVERARQRAAEAHTIAEEQAALRNVATLVARGVPPEEVFAAVTDRAGRLLRADETGLGRYDADGVVYVGVAGDALTTVPVGTRATLGGRNISTLVFDTGRSARIDDYSEASGEAGKVGRPWVNRSALGVPVRPGGRLWGVFIVMSRTAPFPPGTEEQLAGFAELVATAVANAENKAQLTASRARIVATADATRRRIERDLHDGVQQHLVSLALALRGAREALPPSAGGAAAELDGVARGLRGVLDELREITRGIHPAALAQGGLRPALRALARRSAVPVRLDVDVEVRLPESVELAAYYTVCEALTNAAKHAQASVVDVHAGAGGGVLRIEVRDDGFGGATVGSGSGLVGLTDRVAALGGRLTVHSPLGVGTTLRVVLPLTEPTGLQPERLLVHGRVDQAPADDQVIDPPGESYEAVLVEAAVVAGVDAGRPGEHHQARNSGRKHPPVAGRLVHLECLDLQAGQSHLPHNSRPHHASARRDAGAGRVGQAAALDELSPGVGREAPADAQG
jgi:signal transduction histidine kinase